MNLLRGGSTRHRSSRTVRRIRLALVPVGIAAALLTIPAVAVGGHTRPPDHPRHPAPPAHPDLPPTTPAPPTGGFFDRLEMLAIVDQFPPALVQEFEILYFEWIAYFSSGDNRLPFGEWLLANGIEEPEEFELLMLLYELLVALS